MVTQFDLQEAGLAACNSCAVSIDCGSCFRGILNFSCIAIGALLGLLFVVYSKYFEDRFFLVGNTLGWLGLTSYVRNMPMVSFLRGTDWAALLCRLSMSGVPSTPASEVTFPLGDVTPQSHTFAEGFVRAHSVASDASSVDLQALEQHGPLSAQSLVHGHFVAKLPVTPAEGMCISKSTTSAPASSMLSPVFLILL
jgi:hypothetical protein